MNAINPIVQAKHLSKRYGNHLALDNINFEILPGRILGLIGPNGAGKTSLLKSILGLTSVQGELHVIGMNPAKQRTRLMENVSYIADTAIMPKWLKVNQAVDYFAGVHPRFRIEKAKAFLEKTKIKHSSRVGELSKGMVTQLHLALVMAIDSRLLVLDEPTLGLDIVFRKQFYSSLLNDYFDEEKTIILTTHQVEEVENIFTDLMFINQGRSVLNCPLEHLETQFSEIFVSTMEKSLLLDAGLKPIGEQAKLGGSSLIFESVERKKLLEYGDVRTPSIADIFVAKMGSCISGGSQ